MSDTPSGEAPPALYRAVQAEMRAKRGDGDAFDLGEWILLQRRAGKSFPEIGYVIRDAIGQYVSHETLRRWAREAETRTDRGEGTDEIGERHAENLRRWEANHPED
jgi:hypothetical protein